MGRTKGASGCASSGLQACEGHTGTYTHSALPVESTARATVTSAASLFWCVVGVGELLLLGWISRSYGIPGIYVSGGVYALALGLWLLRSGVQGPGLGALRALIAGGRRTPR